MTYLATESISHTYLDGTTSMPVLTDLSFSAERGETVAILGQSGSGKSTLLNILGGLQAPTQGKVTIGDLSVTDLSSQELTQYRRNRLGFVYQFFNLISSLTVYEQLALVLELNNTPRGDIASSVHSLLGQLGLSEKADCYPDQLSGGEQQRVAIGRALIHKPDILLADEPTGNLDAQTGESVLKLLLDLSRQNNTCCLLVTHSRQVAESADRILVMTDGKLEAGEADRAW